MRKELLGVSIAAMVTSLTAVPCLMADGAAPTLSISGETNVAVYAFNAKDRAKEQNKGKGQGIHTDIQDTRLNFEAVGNADLYGGMEYSTLIGFTGNPERGQSSVEEVRIRLRGKWGFFVGGNSRGVEDRMSRGAFSVMGATGGFNGNYDRVFNASTGIVDSVNMVGAAKDANKLTYVTPRVNGVQAGVSFTPNTEQKGFAKLRTIGTIENDSTTYDKNNIGLGLNYHTKFCNGLGLHASATAAFGKSQIARRLGAAPAANPAAREAETFFSGERHNTASYALGLVLEYGAFDFGAEYVDNGKSQVQKAIQGRNAGHVISAAAGYKFGVNRVALGFFHSERKLGTAFNHFGVTDVVASGNPKAKANVYSVTYDRNLAKGLVLFGEANYFDHKTDQRWVNVQTATQAIETSLADAVPSNKGHVVMSGIKVRF
jgi:outer membrane protein OmpU